MTAGTAVFLLLLVGMGLFAWAVRNLLLHYLERRKGDNEQ